MTSRSTKSRNISPLLSSLGEWAERRGLRGREGIPLYISLLLGLETEEPKVHEDI